MRQVRIIEGPELNQLVFSFEYDRDLVAAVKALPNRWYNTSTKEWYVDIIRSSIKEVLSICKDFYFQIQFTKADILKALEKEKILNQKLEQESDYTLPPGDYLVYAKRTKEMRIFLVFDYNKVLVEDVKEIPGARFIKNTRRVGWEIDIDLDNIRQVKSYLEQSYVYCNDPGLVSELDKIINSQGVLSRASKAIESKQDLVIHGFSEGLRPFQKAGVEYALKTKKLFIADDMGCGKTIEALATYKASGVDTCLVVCPASVRYNWLSEANKWLSNKKAVILELSKDKTRVQDFGDINIIHYNMLSKIWPLLSNKKIDMAIFDESHRLISKNSQWSKTAYQLSRSLEYCILLSGTPIVNRPSDLVHQLSIIDRLSLFGGEWKFKQRYCDLKKTRFGWDSSGTSNLEELHTRLRSTCFIRRMKEQVIVELPPKQRSYIPISLKPSDRKVYQKAEDDIVDWIIHSQTEIKKYYAKLKNKEEFSQAKFEYETKLKAVRSEALMKISKLRRLSALGKIPDVVDWVNDFMKTGKKLVIFAVHKEVISKLKEYLKEFGVVTIQGDVSGEDRRDNVKAFQEDPDTRIIICNIQAGGVGLTLTASSDVVFVEFDWTVAGSIQAEDRVYRIGQINTVNIWYFYGVDTVDIDIIEVLQKKEKIIDAAIDGITDKDLTESLVKVSIENLKKKQNR